MDMTSIKNNDEVGVSGNGDSDCDDDVSGAESPHSHSSSILLRSQNINCNETVRAVDDAVGDDTGVDGGAEPTGVEANDSSADDEPADDSDDSSMIDETECDRRRSDHMDNLGNLERQFGYLREQLYRARIYLIDAQLLDIKSGTCPEFLDPLNRLQENVQTRIEVAGVLKQLRLENIKHKYYSEQQAAKQHFESEKKLAEDMIYEEVKDKIRRLEEDRHNVDISWADWGTNTRTSKVRGPGRKKAVTVCGPYIVYMLHDEDIMEDWKLIKKALQSIEACE